MKHSALRTLCRTAAATLAALMLLGSLPAAAQTDSTSPDPLASLSNKELAVQAAAEGTVLLENNGVLPLDAASTKLAVFGVNQAGKFYAGGGGSGGSNTTDITTYADAFRQANGSGALSVYLPLLDFYKDLTEERLPDDALMHDAAAFTDTALVTIGRWSEEGVDRTEAEYYLTAKETALLDAVCEHFEHVIVSMNICAVTDLSWVKTYPIDALLVSWMPGQYGASALVKLLTGEITPSGKLADTFADSYEAYPSAHNFGGTHVDYEEDIFVGYRYFETFPDAKEHVLYPFGYGLSYTTFDISGISVQADMQRDCVTVTATVKNTGDHPGKEVMQVYFGHPESNKLGYAAKELAAFQKTDLLQPGEEQTLLLTYALSDMAGYDDTGKIQKSAYILEAGSYPVYVGNSVRNVTEAAKITVEKTTVTEQLSECGVDVMQLSRRLLADGSYEELTQRPPDEAAADDALITDIFGVGTSVLECESFYKTTGNNLLSVSNGAVHNTHEGGTLYYAIRVEADGEYAVWLNTAQGANVGTNCLRVTVDDELQEDFKVNIDRTTGGWETYRYFPCGTLYLEEGEHEMKVEIINGAVGNIESFRICAEDEGEDARFDVSDLTDALVIYADEPTTIRAQDYTKTTNTSLSVNGGGYLEGLHLGGTITYELYAEATADYLVSFRLACGNDGSDNVLPLQVDGVQQQHFQLSTKGGTGGWDRFADVSAGHITLKAGKNTVVMMLGSGFNPASFTLTRLPGAPAKGFTDRAQVPEDQIIPLSAVYADNTKMDAFLEQLTTSELMHLVQGRGSSSQWGALERYGVPTGTVSDGPAGLRAGTYWPVSVMQACTWNVPLLEQIGLRIGKEAFDMGVDVWLAPALNIHRNPLNGRNFEYYAEDPYLSGAMAAAVVSGVQAQGVAVTLKHLAANNCEAHRDISDSRMSERAMREIYLEGFRVALKLSDAWGIMTSYNRINSREPAESYDILTTIVREEWGFDGLIMSDWWNNSNEAAELLAGNNLKMPEGNPAELFAAFQSEQLTRDILKDSARRVLELMFRIDRLKKVFDPAFKHVHATEPLRPAEQESEPLPPPPGEDIPSPEPPATEETPSPGKRSLAWIALPIVVGAAAVLTVLIVLRQKKKR